MNKEIYKLFTSENGIIISMPALNYLSAHIKDQERLQAFFSAFKSKFNTSSIELEQIKEILANKKEEAEPYIVKTFKYKQRSFPDEFEHYKSLINREVVSISTLEMQTDSTIFGVLYKNRFGAYVVEDDHDFIELDFENVAGEAFVFENMFLGISGAKRQRPETIRQGEERRTVGDAVFEVGGIVIPTFSINSSENSFLDKSKKKICIFGGYENQKGFLESVLRKENPDIVIVSSKTGNPAKELAGWGEKIICCSCDGGFLPSQAQSTSNPFILELADANVGFMDSEFFKNRQSGVFLNGNLISSFLKSYLSQSSLDPFSRSDMRLREMPGFIVFSQNTYPTVLDVESVKFISLPPVRDRAYAVLDFRSEDFRVVYDKH